MAYPKIGVEAEVKGFNSFMGKVGKMTGAVAGFGKTAAKVAIGGVAAFGAATIGIGAGMVKLASDATELQGIRDAFAGIAEAAGKSQQEMLAEMERGSLGMVRQKDLMATFNEAAQLVGTTFATQLPDAMGYLGKVSAATGQDMDFMLDSLVKGVGRLSPMILDNLGIQVSLADSVAAAAEQFGVEADQLTKAQQQAGMMTVVLEKLAENTANMPEVAGTAAQAQAEFAATLANTKDQIGLALLPTFTKLMTNVASFAREVLPKLVSAFATKFVPFLDNTVMPVLGTLTDIVGAIMSQFGSWGDFPWEDILPEQFVDVAYDVAEALEGLYQWLAEAIPDAIDILGNAWSNVLYPVVSGIVSKVIRTLQNMVTFVRAAIDVGGQFVGIIRGIIENIMHLVNWGEAIHPSEYIPGFFELPEAIQGVVSTIIEHLQNIAWFVTETVVPAISQLVSWLGTNVPVALQTVSDFVRENIKPILAGLATIIGVVLVNAAAGFVASAAGIVAALIPIIAPIAAIGAAGALLYQAWTTNWNGIRDKVTEVWENTIRPFLSETVPAAIATLKEWWTTHSDEIMEKVEEVWEVVEEVWGFIVDYIEFQIDNYAAIIEAVMKAVQGDWEGAWNTIKGRIEEVWSAIQSIIETALPIIKDAIEAAWAYIRDDLVPAVWPVIQDAVAAAWDALKTTVIPAALTAIENAIKTAWEWLRDTFIPDVWPKIRNAIGAVWTELKDTIIPNALTAIESAIKTAWEWLRDTFIPTIWPKIRDAVIAVLDWLWETGIPEALGAIERIIVTAWEILRDFVIPQLWEAIKTVIGTVWDALWETVIPTALDLIENVITTAWEYLRDDLVPTLWEEITGAVEDVWDTLTEETIPRLLEELGQAIDTGLQAVEQLFIDTANYMLEIGGKIVANLKQGIENAWQGLVDWFKGKVNDLLNILPSWSPPRDPTSPLARLPQAGAGIVGEIMIGMQEAWPELIRTAENLAQDLIDAIVDVVEAESKGIPSTLDYLFGFTEFGKAVGGSEKDFIRRWEDSFLDPMEKDIEHAAERTAFFRAEWERLRADPTASVGEVTAALDLYQQHYDRLQQLSNEYALAQEKILAIEQQRADLEFLQSQLDLLELISSYGLDPDQLLGGLTLGLDANIEDLLNVLSEAMSQIITTVDDQLGIGSPSREFMRIGREMMTGMAVGIQRTAALPATFGAMASQQVIDNSRSVTIQAGGNTIASGMDEAAFFSGVRRTVREAMGQ